MRSDSARAGAGRLTVRRRWGLDDLLRPAPTTILLVLAACVPLVVTESYNLANYQLVVTLAIVAVGMNLSLGFGGEFVLGHVVALGAGAYAAGYMNVEYGWGLLPSIIPALVVGTLVGLIIHLPGLRIMGWTLAVIGFVAVIAFGDVVDLADKWTGGEDGLIGLQAPAIGGHLLSPAQFYELSVVVLAIVVILVSLLVRSSWGLRMRYLRDAPRALESVGVSVVKTKLLLYVASAVPAAAAGWLMANNYQYVAPTQFDFHLLTLLLAAVFIGGRGTLLGPLVGTLVVQITSLILGPTNQYNSLVFGIVLFLVVVLLPAGLVPSLASLWGRITRGRRTVPAAATENALEHEAPEGDVTQVAVLPSVLSGGERLAIEGVSKAFFGNSVLRDLDLAIQPGRLTALVGPNGSGKTTVVNLVTGFLTPDSGVVVLGDRIISGMSPVHIARAGVRRTFQVPQLSLSMSVADNVATGLLTSHSTGMIPSLLRTPGFWKKERARRSLVESACSACSVPPELLDRPASELSLAMRRQVEVARAVVADAPVLLLDEPASGLNAEEVHNLADLLRATAGPSVLVIEHNVNFVVNVADDVYLLDAGAVVAHADLSSDAALPGELARYMGVVPELDLEPHRTVADHGEPKPVSAETEPTGSTR